MILNEATTQQSAFKKMINCLVKTLSSKLIAQALIAIVNVNAYNGISTFKKKNLTHNDHHN